MVFVTDIKAKDSAGVTGSPTGRAAPKIRPNRMMKVSSTMPSEEDLAAIKHKKKVGTADA